jgi:hypothetical protein
MSKSNLGATDSPQITTPATAPVANSRVLFGARKRGSADLSGPIAAVGNNTGNTGEHAYVIGFAYAAKVLLRSLTRRAQDTDEFIPEDALIHPIAYNARHFVELFLKDIPREIHALRGKEPEAVEGHDLKKLWPAFEKACATDRRLKEFPAKLRDAVFKMADLDPTGQTFRYRRSTGNQVHLASYAVISVREFEQDFERMFGIVNYLYDELEGIEFEYILGTYTDTLSRSDLEDIAECIGAAVVSGKAALKAAEAEIRATYLLSKSQYAEARALIENHYLFSLRAGHEQPLKELSPETLAVAAFAIVVREAADLLERLEIAALWGVLFVGDILGAAEDYDPQVKAFMEGSIPTSTEDVIRELRNKPVNLRRGLVRLGQPSLIAALDALVPPDELQQFQEFLRSHRG